MTEQEDFIVENAYQPTEEEKQAISELKSKGLTAKDWESGKKGIKSYKDNLRDYMYYEQNCRCAYCRIELRIGCSFMQREHIVYKDLHPQWMFEPRNLCVVCDRCNNFKQTTEVLSNPEANTFPEESKDFLIVNPFLDKYSEHIELKNGIIYEGKTDKGKFTVETCHLYRIDLALERAKMRMEKENPDTIQAQMLVLLSTIPASVEEINKVKENLKKIVRMYKRSH